MGANLTPGGTTFRLWAPNADHVYLVLNPGDDYAPSPGDELVKNEATGHWTGFAAGVGEAAQYKFWVVGKGSTGFKRDPYARELTRGNLIGSHCIVRDADRFPWHDAGFRPPAFSDLIVYQLHIGTFYGVDAAGDDTRGTRVAKFLDVLWKLEYLADLGINAIEPLPVTEFSGATSLGYNGSDLFSPEMDYSVPPGPDLDRYLAEANRLLAAKRPDAAPFTAAQLEGQVNQLKAMVDLFHVHGIAVLFDVVYNHAGGFGGDGESLFFLDRDRPGDNNRSLYFTDQDWAGGLVFDFRKSEVRGFLIDNARFFLGEYHVDGLRHDEVTVIDSHGGWSFCQDLTRTEHFSKEDAIEIAEYWRNDKTWVVRSPAEGGAGFDSVWNDGLRSSIRTAISQAACGAGAFLDLDAIAGALYRGGFPACWRKVEYVESHDEVYLGHGGVRIARLADPNDSRSWYARSRARVATGLILTGTGIPMLFMGQEFLEDKHWSDNPEFFHDTLIWWDGLGSDKVMQDHLRFTRELTWLRRRHPALRGEGINVFHVHNANRVLAFHRWLEGVGRDVVVVASLREQAFPDHSYRLGFPLPGHWNEVFNSDVYDNFFNPSVQGNPGGISADGAPMHGLRQSSGITLPANGLLVFARDDGD